MEGDISQKPGYTPEPTKGINHSSLPTNTTPIDPLEPTSPATQHFGPAPVGRIRRRHKQRRVQSTSGSLALDTPVPPNESNRSTELFICCTMYNVRPSFVLDLHDLT